MSKEVIDIPPITLEWSEWFAWNTLKEDARLVGISPPDEAGVYEVRYEVRYEDRDERLTIGRASNLRMRVKQGLVKGKVPHPAGARIRSQEDVSQIVLRWAVTDRRSAVEEELLKRYRSKFGKLPKHTKQT